MDNTRNTTIAFLGQHPYFLLELAKLHFDEWRHFRPGRTPQDRIDKLRAMAKSEELPCMVVAIHENGLIGSTALVHNDMSTRRDVSPWLASVYFKSEFRRNGIATIPVGHIEKLAEQRGIRKLYLHTEHARDLYASLGWVDLQAVECQGVNVVIMSRQPGNYNGDGRRHSDWLSACTSTSVIRRSGKDQGAGRPGQYFESPWWPPDSRWGG